MNFSKVIKSAILVCVLMMSMMSIAFAGGVSVSADSKTFDFASGCIVLDGHVVVETDSRTIKADKAKVNLSSKEVWADGNIYLSEPDQEITFSGGALYASDESKTAVIKGGVEFTRPDLTIQAEKCSFNWKTKIAEFSDLVEVKQDGKIGTYDSVIYNVKTNTIESEK